MSYPFGGPPARSQPSANTLYGAVTINAISDSEFGIMSIAMDKETYGYVPARPQNANVVLGGIYQDGGYSYRCTAAGTTANVSAGPSTSFGTGSLAGGTGYTPGTYNGVTLTGGTATVSPVANITVNAGGNVSSVVFTNLGLGVSVGDVLTCPASSIGGTVTTAWGYTVLQTGNGLGAGATITDGAASFTWLAPTINKYADSPLFWIEAWSLGRVRWNMNDGYCGLQGGVIKAFVIAPGTVYTSNDSWSAANGAAGNLLVNGSGGIIGATVTNPGTPTGSARSATINTSTGSGGAISLLVNPSGTFAVSGAQTQDMVFYLQDAVASPTDIVIVFGGTNDASLVSTQANYLTQYAATIANLGTIYTGLLAAGKKVVAAPIRARSSMGSYQLLFIKRVNNWIKAYARKLAWSNPSLYANFAFADINRYSTDLTSTAAAPVGGTAAANGAFTREGLHQAPRGAQYDAICYLEAISKWVPPLGNTGLHLSDASDGYDYLANPGGNMVEAAPWVGGQYAPLNDTCSNNGNVYYCTAAGITAATGGPTGTGGGNIYDGGATWIYSRPVGTSVMMGTPTALSSPPTGITYSGSVPASFGVGRKTGSASGLVAATIENPYSDGQPGQRVALQFSLGGGTDNEVWQYYLNVSRPRGYGLVASLLDNMPVQAEAEIEVTGQQNLIAVRFGFFDLGTNHNIECGFSSQSASGTHLTEMNATGEMLTPPVRRYLVTGFIPVSKLAYIPSLQFLFAFDASGQAGSATATIKINSIRLSPATAG